MKSIWFKAPKTASTSIRAALLGFADTVKDFDRHRSKFTRAEVLQTLVDFFPFGKINGWYLGGDFPSKDYICQVNGDQWYSYKERYSCFYSQAYKFGVCRHPLDRFVSGYKYVRNETGLSLKSTLEVLLCGKEGASKQLGHYAFEHLRPLHNFTPNDGKSHSLDFVIRFETLQLGFNQVCNDLGIPYVKLPLTRQGYSLENYNAETYMDMFDSESEAMAREYFRKDFKFFNYE